MFLKQEQADNKVIHFLSSLASRMQFAPLFFLLMYCFFSSAQDCFSGFLEFTVTCRGESYSGPLRIELVDTHSLRKSDRSINIHEYPVLDDTIEDVQYQVNGLEDIVYFKVNLNKMKRCWEIKPKLTFYSTCSVGIEGDSRRTA